MLYISNPYSRSKYKQGRSLSVNPQLKEQREKIEQFKQIIDEETKSQGQDYKNSLLQQSQTIPSDNVLEYENSQFEKSYFTSDSSTNKYRVVHKSVQMDRSEKSQTLETSRYLEPIPEQQKQKFRKQVALYGNKNIDKKRSDINKLKQLYSVGVTHINYNSNAKKLVDMKQKYEKNEQEKQLYFEKQKQFIEKHQKILDQKKYSSQRTVEVSKFKIRSMKKEDMEIVNKKFVPTSRQPKTTKL